MPNPWVVCTKCSAKWIAEALDRKRQYACPLCKEPGMRIMDAKGEATEEGWPTTDARKGKEAL